MVQAAGFLAGGERALVLATGVDVGHLFFAVEIKVHYAGACFILPDFRIGIMPVEGGLAEEIADFFAGQHHHRLGPGLHKAARFRNVTCRRDVVDAAEVGAVREEGGAELFSACDAKSSKILIGPPALNAGVK